MLDKVRAQLAKLRIRSGRQRTTWTIQDHPLITLDFAWHDGGPALVLSWPGLGRKTVAIGANEYTGHERHLWISDATLRLTPAAIERLAPGLADVIPRLLGAWGVESGDGDGSGDGQGSGSGRGSGSGEGSGQGWGEGLKDSKEVVDKWAAAKGFE